MVTKLFGKATTDSGKVKELILELSKDLDSVDPMKVISRVVDSRDYRLDSEKVILELATNIAGTLISEEPQYSILASRLLHRQIENEVKSNWIFSFKDSITRGYELGLIAECTKEKVDSFNGKLEKLIQKDRNDLIKYFGLRVLYDRYFIKNSGTNSNGETGTSIETIQYFWMRVACGLGDSLKEIKEIYELMSTLRYVPSTPTLFNSGLVHSQMSSCYILDSPEDDLKAIYDKMTDIAQLSKFAGGIGLSYSRVRSQGSLIRGTNGTSSGIIPFLKTLDMSVAAVNQGGKRKGAACVYLEPWHADIEAFLELRNNTGSEERRAHNINIALWIPDLFMQRVEQDESWSLFDPKDVPQLVDTYGGDFEKHYLQAESELKFVKKIKARELYGRMMRTLAETGNGWMTFKDSSNRKSNQTLNERNIIHSSNLCTEILEVTDPESIAVCNLGSINLSKFVTGDKLDYEHLGKVAKTAVRYLDKVIDKNFYPVKDSSKSNRYWRPVGLGIMGFQDVLFKLRIPFESGEAVRLAEAIQEVIYFNALEASWELAKELGPCPAFNETRTSLGFLQFDLWGAEPKLYPRIQWKVLRERIRKDGIRNSLLIAIAPTATIASISGCYESIEPQVSNLFKRETLSGEFLQINEYLVEELKALNLWNQEMRDSIKRGEGSIQDIPGIPYSTKQVFKTAWEISQKALIDIAVARGAFIDQSQSLSFFVEEPTIEKLSSMYMYAWKRGIKTTYYLRSRPASSIAKSTLRIPIKDDVVLSPEEAAVIACSLENPESCEACQ